MSGQSIDRADAELRAEQIRRHLDDLADTYSVVMPMIREAIEQQDYFALGYRSPGEYVSDRFGGALTRLGADVRRVVVAELSAAGMSVRAIAPVVGASVGTVHSDQVFRTEHLEAGEPQSPAHHKVAEEAADECPRLAPVIGIDGKTYGKRQPVSRRRLPLTDAYRDRTFQLAKDLRAIAHLHRDDRFRRNIPALVKERQDLLRARAEIDRLLAELDANPVIEGRVTR